MCGACAPDRGPSRHEIGHYALGHNDLDLGDCASEREIEADADRFAVALMRPEDGLFFLSDNPSTAGLERGFDRRFGSGIKLFMMETHRLSLLQDGVCLLSALRVHDLTTQLPHAVWLMIGRKDRAPASASRLQVVRASGAARTEGIMHALQDGVEIKLTTPAKTVADCFKYRNRVGLDVAIEALRDGLQRKAFTVDEFMQMAQADRVARIARPYLEALV